MDTNLPTKQGTWEDSNIIISIAPTSIENIYSTAIEYDRSQRVIITTKSEQIRAKYSLYDSLTFIEDFKTNTSVTIPITEIKNTLTVVCNETLYKLTYNIQSKNIQNYTSIDGIMYSDIKNIDYNLDNNTTR